MIDTVVKFDENRLAVGMNAEPYPMCATKKVWYVPGGGGREGNKYTYYLYLPVTTAFVQREREPESETEG